MEKIFRVKEDTRTSSPTLDNESSDFSLPHNQLQGQGSMSAAAEWTDEKHSMYLKSMETSFVDQLYDSKEILDCLSSRIKNASSDTIITSGKFKVLRGGSWQKISFVRENPHGSRQNRCNDLKKNPWFQHYQSPGKQGSLAAPVVEETVTPTSDLGQMITRFPSVSSRQLDLSEPRMFPQDFMCSDTEMSGQNFTDDEEVEVEVEKENNRRNVKRLKSS